VQVTILGCGTSGGVPRVGGTDGSGEWGAAASTDPRNRRRRCSILVQDRGKTLLVDTSPDLRSQLLDAQVERLDAVLWTHEHADQVHGIDDVRPYALRQGAIEAWADKRTHDILLRRFRYCFEAEGDGFYNPIYRHHQIDGPFKAAEALRTTVRDIPLDRLLVETDAPYLAPVPKRGKTNEPAFVAHTAAKVAELKDVGLAELEAATTDNFFRLFTKAERAKCG